MKRYLPLTALLLAACVVIALLAGCRNAVSSQGTPCYGITASDQRKLIETARTSLSKSNRLVTPAEYAQYIAAVEPLVKERYNGDLFGSVKIQWTLPKKQVGIIFHGELMSDAMSATAEIIPTPGEDDIIYDHVPGKNGVPEKPNPFRRNKKWNR